MDRDRVVMFSDGVFAIVVTLLVLEISTGNGNAWRDLHSALPLLGVFAWSFFLTARFWQLHVRLFDALRGEKIPSGVVDINSLLLFFVALVPFSTRFYSEHYHQAWGLAVYAIVITLIGLTQARLRLKILEEVEGKSPEITDVRNIWPFVIVPVVMAVSIPVAFLSSIVSYVLWVALILLNIGQGLIRRRKKQLM